MPDGLTMLAQSLMDRYVVRCAVFILSKRKKKDIQHTKDPWMMDEPPGVKKEDINFF